MDLTQAMLLNKKAKPQQQKFWMWIVNYSKIVSSDRQFYGAVHVISQTVVLILSWIFKEDCEVVTYVCIIPRLLVKQGTFLKEAWPNLVEKRDILSMGNLDIKDFEIGNLFIGKLFIPSESRTLHFLNCGLFMDGRKKTKEYVNSKLTELWAGHWYICLAEFKKCILIWFFWLIVIIIGNNKL